MHFPATPHEPGMPAYAFAQILESGILEPAAVAKFRAILSRAGIDMAALLTPGAQAPVCWFREVYPTLSAEQAACIGYAAGEQVRLTSYSLLSVPLVSAGSVSDALHLLTFLPLIANSISARFVERDDAVLIMLITDSGDPVLDCLPLFYCAAALTRLLEILTRDPLDLTVHLACPAPAALMLKPEYLAGRLRFNAPMHYIVVPRATLDAVCQFSDPIAYQNAVANLQAAMLRQHQPDITDWVRQQLDSRTGLVRIDAVAQALNMSVSTLKRRLAATGTTFSQLLEETLRDRAQLMLTDPSLTLEAVATALGYSDLTNFSHAFKRWTGSAPGQFRKGVVTKMPPQKPKAPSP